MWDYFYFQDEQQCIWQHALNSCYSCGVSSSFSYALVSASTSQYGIPKSSGTTKRSWKDYKSRTSREGIHYRWICGKKLVSIHIIILIFVSDCKCVLLSVCCNTSICYSNILLSLFCVSFQNSWWAFKSEKKKMTREKVGPLHIATLIFFFFSGGLTWGGSELPMESPALFFPTPTTSEDSTTIMQSARQFTLALDSLKQVTRLNWLGSSLTQNVLHKII